MKSCIEFKEMISGYLDNELDSGLISEFENHISNCISCREELNETRETLDLLNSISEEELPQDFTDILHMRLVEEKINLDKKNYTTLLRNKYFRIIGSVAAVLIFAILLKGFWDNHNPSISSSQDAARQNVAYAPEKTMAEVGSQSTNGTQDIGAMRKSVSNNEFGSAIEPKAEAKGTENPQVTLSDATAVKAAEDVKLGKVKAAPAERIIKNTVLTLKVKDPEKEIENIKVGLVQNGAKVIEKLNLQPTVQFSVKATEKPEVKTFQLEFIIPNSDFSKILDYLKASWGGTAITTKDIEAIKVADEINQLNAELKELNVQIENFDKNNQNGINLDEIIARKSKIQIEVEDLSKDTEYTIVSMTVEIN